MGMHSGSRVLVGSLLLVVSFDAAASEDNTCAHECPSHRMQHVMLPIESAPRDVSILLPQPSAVQVIFPGVKPEVIRRGGEWVNFTAGIRDGKYCVSAPGIIEETCDSKTDTLELEVMARTSALWRFDCESDTSCGCREHRFLQVQYSLIDLPVHLYIYPGLNVTGLLLFGEPVPLPPGGRERWHDISMTRIGREVVLNSSSLDISYREQTNFLMVEGIDDEIQYLPSLFAFGCKPLRKGPTSTSMDSCIDGCPAYRVGLVEFPFSDSTLEFSMWSPDIPSVVVNFDGFQRNVQTTSADSWLNITVFKQKGSHCLSAPGISFVCRSTWEFLRISHYPSTKTLIKFNCESVSCECHHHRLHRLGFNPIDVPARFFWRPGPKVAKFLASEVIFLVSGSAFLNITSRQWYDVEVTTPPTDRSGFLIRSNSFNISLERPWDSVIFSSVDEYGDMEASDFAFGCDEPPKDEYNERILEDLESKGSLEGLAIVVGVSVAVVVSVLTLTLIRWRQEAARRHDTPQHEPQLPLPSALGPPPPVPRPLEGEGEEGDYYEIDEEALKMQLARERMGLELLALRAQSGKKEEEKDSQDGGKEVEIARKNGEREEEEDGKDGGEEVEMVGKDREEEEEKDAKEGWQDMIWGETHFESANPMYVPFFPHEEGTSEEEEMDGGRDS